jgi:hypothetical protein
MKIIYVNKNICTKTVPIKVISASNANKGKIFHHVVYIYYNTKIEVKNEMHNI